MLSILMNFFFTYINGYHDSIRIANITSPTDNPITVGDVVKGVDDVAIG